MLAKVFYHLLGATAWANERSSHYSTNFIPGNWIILVAIGGFLLIGFPELANAWLYGAPTSMNYGFMVCLMTFLTVAMLFFLATFCSQYVVFQKRHPISLKVPPHLLFQVLHYSRFLKILMLRMPGH